MFTLTSVCCTNLGHSSSYFRPHLADLVMWIEHKVLLLKGLKQNDII